MLTATQLAQLKSEIQTDPASLGYAPFVTAKDWNSICGLINDPTKGGTINVTSVTAQQLQQCVNPTEYLALTSPKQMLWLSMLMASEGSVSINNTSIVAQAVAIWPSGGPTITALGTLRTRTGSRAEALFGQGTVVNYYDVYYLGL